MSGACVVAIDGPVAAGKTVVGRALSLLLGYRFLDTGLMYRALTWVALERGIDIEDAEALGRLAQEVAFQLEADPTGQRIRMAGRDITPSLRAVQVERRVSQVSRIRVVREAMVRRQRELATGGNIIMVGRDIGTVVVPQAALKVFLQASPAERARRRYQEQREMGQAVTYEEVLRDLKRRDQFDTERAASPLRPAEDAVVLETDGLTVEEVAARICSLLKVC